jgi:electron transfer flavoprotein beta subunit
MSQEGSIAACLKWVDQNPDVDRLTGAVHTDGRTSGASPADSAALEWALRLGARWHRPVVAVTAGPPGADTIVREALAAGAAAGVRADLPAGADSHVVAAALAVALPQPVELVLCGVWSLDRGTGSVPAFLAAELDAVQALGLVSLEPEETGAELRLLGERRLDAGRRERLRVRLPAVCSVEAASARLRRASLEAVVASRQATVSVVSVISVASVMARRSDRQRPLPRPEPGVRAGKAARAGAGVPVEPGTRTDLGVRADLGAPNDLGVRVRPFRPRAKERPAPPSTLSARERILALTGSLGDREPPQTLVLDPPAAADELLARLRHWGYLP